MPVNGKPGPHVSRLDSAETAFVKREKNAMMEIQIIMMLVRASANQMFAETDSVKTA